MDTIMTYLSDGLRWASGHPAEALLAFLGLATVMVPQAHRFLVAWQRYTERTVNTIDDGIVRRLLIATEIVAGLLEALNSIIPIVSIRRLSQPRPSAPSSERPTGSGVGGVPMLCIAFGLLAAGCAGTTPEARDARQDAWAAGLGAAVSAYETIATVVVIPRFQAKGAGCRAASADEAGYEACIAPFRAVMVTMTGIWGTLQEARYALEAGDGREEALACLPWAVGELRRVLEVVTALDLGEVPDEVTVAVSVAQIAVGAFTGGGECTLAGGG